MGFRYFNPNPKNKLTGDCVIRAISKALDMSWDDTYVEIVMVGYEVKDMPSTNHTWGTYLSRHGFIREGIPNNFNCEDCYTIRDFCEDNPNGVYLLVTDGHVVAAKNGNYYDSWDSGNEIPIYYWKKV